MTGSFPNTSALYILIIPSFTLAQVLTCDQKLVSLVMKVHEGGTYCRDIIEHRRMPSQRSRLDLEHAPFGESPVESRGEPT